jgi:hypothetical protein
MARQKGIIKLDGTVGGITFYKSKDGYLAREKGGVSADKIANDPNFQRTRENGEEFGRAGKADLISFCVMQSGQCYKMLLTAAW